MSAGIRAGPVRLLRNGDRQCVGLAIERPTERLSSPSGESSRCSSRRGTPRVPFPDGYVRMDVPLLLDYQKSLWIILNGNSS
jgi:hypothetical protein